MFIFYRCSHCENQNRPFEDSSRVLSWSVSGNCTSTWICKCLGWRFRVRIYPQQHARVYLMDLVQSDFVTWLIVCHRTRMDDHCSQYQSLAKTQFVTGRHHITGKLLRRLQTSDRMFSVATSKPTMTVCKRWSRISDSHIFFRIFSLIS